MNRELNSFEKAAIKREQHEIDNYDRQLSRIEDKMDKFIKEQGPKLEYFRNLKKMKQEIIAQINAGATVEDAPACVSPVSTTVNPNTVSPDTMEKIIAEANTVIAGDIFQTPNVCSINPFED